MFDLWKYIEQAGIIGYLLLGVSTIASAVIIERYWFWFMQPGRITKATLQKLFIAFKTKDRTAIKQQASKIKGLEGDALESVARNLYSEDDTPLDIAMNNVVDSSTQFLWILELCAVIAPMFGILGTVAGIIVSFDGISGDVPNTGVMVSGVSVSMTTTAIGLLVALLSSIPSNHLSKKAHDKQVEIATRLQECWIYKNMKS